jgi:predicted DCC family thiol-disulfide oxidoreductase YuxK
VSGGDGRAETVRPEPILLFNDECGVCRSIAGWVRRSKRGRELLDVRPIGDDPEALRRLDARLAIWDAYATIHLLMPDGSTKRGGEAVAEVLRRLPNTKWFSGLFALSVLGGRPFQELLDLGYAALSDVRPLFGCESCGAPSVWVRPIAGPLLWAKALLRGSHGAPRPSHSTARAGGTAPRTKGAV